MLRRSVRRGGGGGGGGGGGVTLSSECGLFNRRLNHMSAFDLFCSAVFIQSEVVLLQLMQI